MPPSDTALRRHGPAPPERDYGPPPDLPPGRDDGHHGAPRGDLREQAAKRPPAALDIEVAVLGAALVEPNAAAELPGLLTAEDYYDHRNGAVHNAICALVDRNEPVDLLTVTDQLRRAGSSVDGYYLAGLTTRVASAANVEYHARIVLEKSLARRFIRVATEAIGALYDETNDVFEEIDRAEESLSGAVEPYLTASDSYTSADLTRDALARYEEAHARRDEEGTDVTGVASGLHALDEYTAGWQPSDMVVIAARPSMGKTSLALSVARTAALRDNVGVAFFNLESSAKKLYDRLMAAEAGVSSQALRRGTLTDEEWPKVARAGGRLQSAPIFIEDVGDGSVQTIRQRARRLKRLHDIGIVVVDYLQLIRGDTRMPREQQVATISRSLKLLAKELDVPVLVLSQLSRACESRPDKRPMLSDLRESGAIEQDADVVLFVYRDERYGIMMDDKGRSTEGVAELILGKQRDGPIGTAMVGFSAASTRFHNLSSLAAPPGAYASGAHAGPPPLEYEPPPTRHFTIGAASDPMPPPTDAPF